MNDFGKVTKTKIKRKINITFLSKKWIFLNEYIEERWG